MSKIKNWQLPILAVIVSVLSIGLIYQYAQAQWQNPGQLPGQSGPGVIVVNPMTTNLDLNNKDLSNGRDISANKITASGNVEGNQVCIGTDCKSAWPTGFWQAGMGYDHETDIGNIHYSSGKVGIGIDNPNVPLHVYSATGDNAEIKLQSTDNNNLSWGIYQNREMENSLIFWNNGNKIYFATDGSVGIKTQPLTGYALTVEGAIRANIPGSGYAIKALASGSGATAVWGEGNLGGNFISTANNGTGLKAYAGAGSGGKAGEFYGTLKINDSDFSQKGYLHLNIVTSLPPIADCAAYAHQGRMVYASMAGPPAHGKLIICAPDPAGGYTWKHLDLN